VSRVLLDTHIFIWVYFDSSELSQAVRRELSLRSTVPYVSVASLWEIAIKVSRGALILDDPLEEVIQREFEANGYVRLDIEDRHLTELGKLPKEEFSHGDPFDRLLAAQARTEGLDLLSVDAKLDAFGVRRIS